MCHICHISLSNLHFCCFCQNQYGQERVRRHGEQIDWRKANVTPVSLNSTFQNKLEFAFAN
jgi:hypothetical protein